MFMFEVATASPATFSVEAIPVGHPQGPNGTSLGSGGLWKPLVPFRCDCPVRVDVCPSAIALALAWKPGGDGIAAVEIQNRVQFPGSGPERFVVLWRLHRSHPSQHVHVLTKMLALLRLVRPTRGHPLDWVPLDTELLDRHLRRPLGDPKQGPLALRPREKVSVLFPAVLSPS